jgi:hypothetical protein
MGGQCSDSGIDAYMFSLAFQGRETRDQVLAALFELQDNYFNESQNQDS